MLHCDIEGTHASLEKKGQSWFLFSNSVCPNILVIIVVNDDAFGIAHPIDSIPPWWNGFCSTFSSSSRGGPGGGGPGGGGGDGGDGGTGFNDGGGGGRRRSSVFGRSSSIESYSIR